MRACFALAGPGPGAGSGLYRGALLYASVVHGPRREFQSLLLELSVSIAGSRLRERESVRRV